MAGLKHCCPRRVSLAEVIIGLCELPGLSINSAHVSGVLSVLARDFQEAKLAAKEFT